MDGEHVYEFPVETEEEVIEEDEVVEEDEVAEFGNPAQ